MPVLEIRPVTRDDLARRVLEGATCQDCGGETEFNPPPGTPASCRPCLRQPLHKRRFNHHIKKRGPRRS